MNADCCPDCGNQDCGCDPQAESILNRDACPSKQGTASPCPSTACDSKYQGTSGIDKGVLLAKRERAGRCLHTLEGEGFVVGDGKTDEHTNQPNVNVPLANAYERNLDGSLLRDAHGNPIPGPVPSFKHLWISGVENQDPNALFRIAAPESEEALYLVGSEGAFAFTKTQRQTFGSNERPENLTQGNLLIIPPAEKCEDPSWRGRVLDFSAYLAKGSTAFLRVKQDAELGTIIEPLKTDDLKGFLRIDPETGSFATSTELTEDEAALLKSYVNAMLCSVGECDCEDEEETPEEPARILTCGPTQEDGTPGGLSGLKVTSLFNILEKKRPEPTPGSDTYELDFSKPLVSFYDPNTGEWTYRHLEDYIPAPVVNPEARLTLHEGSGVFDISTMGLDIPDCGTGTLYMMVQGWIMNQNNDPASMVINGQLVTQTGKNNSGSAVASGFAYLEVPANQQFNVVLSNSLAFTPATGLPLPRVDFHGFVCKAATP